MKEAKAYGKLLGLIFLVAFNAVFFLVGGFSHPASVWIAYAMINVSYLLLLSTTTLFKGKKTAAEGGSPLFLISVLNFLLHFVTGLIFILVAPEKLTFEIVLYVILLVIYGIPYLALQMARAHTASSLSQNKEDTFMIRNRASKLQALIGRINDKELNKLLERCADDMYASPSESCDAALSAESDIAMKVRGVETAVAEERTDDAKVLCKEILYHIQDRNRIISNSH